MIADLPSGALDEIINGVELDLAYADFSVIYKGEPLGLVYFRPGDRWVARTKNGMDVKHSHDLEELLDWLRRPDTKDVNDEVT